MADNLRHGSAHWPAVPPDATAQDPLHPGEPVEIAPPGSGCGTVALVLSIVAVILLVASYMALIARVAR